MPAAPERTPQAASSPVLGAFEEVSEAVESGAGLPAVARAAGHALDASVVVSDAAGAVMAVACLSPEDERAVLAGEGRTEATELRVADARVGRLSLRARGAPPDVALMRMVTTLIAQEVERARAPERASEAAMAGYLSDLFSRKLTDRENILARAGELGADLGDGATAIVARARPHGPEEGDWRARVLAAAWRGALAVERSSLVARVQLGPASGRGARSERRGATTERHGGAAERHGGAAERHVGAAERRGGTARRPPVPELVILVPGHGDERGGRTAASVHSELELSLPGYGLVVAVSRPAADPTDLHRAAAEALLAANVADARGESRITFEETGAYRLLLPAMSEDPRELQRFHDETVAPIVAYDGQYETELLRTLESFLEADGNVARTAERLFTHRHTIRYRLDRVRELTGLDVGSSDGRERLSLGLKAMRVLGIAPPTGPAYESGAEGGRVPREEKDR